MTVAVPRKVETLATGRTLRGAAGAPASRKVSLEAARADALQLTGTPDGYARLCRLAAMNLDLSAKVLLEAIGQGAPTELLRTRAWILRNGSEIRKGERGYAASMFGAYVFSASQTTRGRFGWGDVGCESGPAPRDELEGFHGLTGDRGAALILAALRGYDVPAESPQAADEASLERSIRIARGVAYEVSSCLSCDGAGCVVCSAADDLRVPPVLPCQPMPDAKSSPVKRGRGRPPKVRPSLPALEVALVESRRLRSDAARLEREAAATLRASLEAARADGASLGDLSAVVGLSRQRIFELLTGGDR